MSRQNLASEIGLGKHSQVDQSADNEAAVVPKKSLWVRFVAEVKHYYHGFKLLGLDVRIASRSLWRILHGEKLLRRELNQFRRAVSDIFRLVPFSVFIIIPGAELALPLAIKLFPNMLPSTFETFSKRETRLKKELRVKLEMSKFLQDTVEEIAVRTKKSSKKSDAAEDFISFLQKIRGAEEPPSNTEILKHAKFFKDQLTLDNMSRQQLLALCKLIQVPAVGYDDLLRFLLQMKLNSISEDDKMIQEEGVHSLTDGELMSACQARGMRALGLSKQRLQTQLSEWIDLHLNHDVPSSLLLLSRVLYLPESVNAENRILEVMSSMPEKATGEALVRAAELNLERVDNTTLYKAAKMQHTELKQEAANKSTLKTLDEGQEVVDSSKVVGIDNTHKITTFDIDTIVEVFNQVKTNDPVLQTAKIDLKELREDVEEYQTDIASLQSKLKEERDAVVKKDTKAGQRIHKRINKMMARVEKIMNVLENEKLHQASFKEIHAPVTDLVAAIKALDKIPDQKLFAIIEALDTNADGIVDVQEAQKILEMIEKEKVELTQEQLKVIVSFISLSEGDKDFNSAAASENASRLEQSKAHLKDLSKQIEKDLDEHMGPSIVDTSPSLGDSNSKTSSKTDIDTVIKPYDSTNLITENNSSHSQKQSHKRINNLIAKVERKMADYDQTSEIKDVNTELHADLAATVRALDNITDEKLLGLFDALEADSKGLVDAKEAKKLIDNIDNDEVELTRGQLTVINQLIGLDSNIGSRHAQ